MDSVLEKLDHGLLREKLDTIALLVNTRKKRHGAFE
jgi:hypothetical protein